MELSNQKRIYLFIVVLVFLSAVCFVAFKIEKRNERARMKAPEVKITIPEGLNISDIENIFANKLPNFDKNIFLLETKDKEGYLFPDTYFFLLSDNSSKAIKAMSDNFNKKIDPLLPEIKDSNHSEKEIITMASIIEREAKGATDRAMISGILWNRLSKGMMLQVDAAPDTYKTKGLPNNPIANPGLEAIKAAIHPQNSTYLFYLHDKTGVIHYALNFAEHQKNISKYLR